MLINGHLGHSWCHRIDYKRAKIKSQITISSTLREQPAQEGAVAKGARNGGDGDDGSDDVTNVGSDSCRYIVLASWSPYLVASCLPPPCWPLQPASPPLAPSQYPLFVLDPVCEPVYDCGVPALSVDQGSVVSAAGHCAYLADHTRPRSAVGEYAERSGVVWPACTLWWR